MFNALFSEKTISPMVKSQVGNAKKSNKNSEKNLRKCAIRVHLRKPCPSEFLTGHIDLPELLLRRGIQAVGFEQSINQPDQFAGSKSECTSVLMLWNLTKFEVVETPKLRVAFS